MNVSLGSAILLASLVGCHSFQDLTLLPDDAQPAEIDMSQRDISVTYEPPTCAAAKGLPGTNLFCADLKNFTNVDALRSADWGVSKDKIGTKECWEVVAIPGNNLKAIQVVNFATFQDYCGFSVPRLENTIFDKYDNFTLSIVHTLNIDRRQSASTFLFQPAAQYQIGTNTGVNPRQVSTITLSKVDVIKTAPVYQPVFQLQSTVTSTLTGWQIESIAINGSND